MVPRVTALLPSAAHRARFWSTAGPHAGSWIGAIPTCGWLCAQSCHFQRALQLRASIPLRELTSGNVLCACGVLVDPWGFHYGVCKRGNRGSAWTWRHDTIEASLIAAVRSLQVRACRVTSNHLGERAVLDPSSRNYLRPDVFFPSYYAVDRHLFCDIAVADPSALSALRATPSSSREAGVAAALRSDRKVAKYGPLCSATGSRFVPAVIERYGACCDALVGLFRQLAGVGDSDPGDRNFSFAASSRVTAVAQRVVFATVIADAAMVSRLASADLSGEDLTAPGRPPAPGSVQFVTDAASAVSHLLAPCLRSSVGLPAASRVSPPVATWRPSLRRTLPLLE